MLATPNVKTIAKGPRAALFIEELEVDELFRKKLTGSGLEPYVELEAQVVGEEKKLIERYAL